MSDTHRLGLVRCVHSFKGISKEEMSINVGDTIVAEKALDPGWLFGTRVTDGQSGAFPADYTTRLDVPRFSEAQKVLLAIETFASQTHGDLSFTKGDVILGLTPIDSNWWKGQMSSGSVGIFPLSFTQDISHFVTKIERWKPTKAMVITSLTAQLPEEIDLFQGEEILITEILDKSWARGKTRDGRVGLVPLGFVQMSSDKSVATSHSDISSSIVPNDNTDIIQTLSEDPLVPYGITKWPFIAQHKEELSFRDGETVFLHRYIDGDWCEGEIEGKIGIFPISYVDIMVDLEGAQSTFSLQNGYEPQSLDEQSITSKKMIRSGQLGSSCCESFLVLYDFIGSEPNDLRCKAGDTVTIMKHINDEWIEGKNLVTHESGIMPICFLDVPNSELTSASMTEVKLRPHSNGETAPNRMSINSTLSSMSSTQAGGQSQQSTQRQERTELRPISITSGFKPPRPQPPVLQAEEQQFKSKTLEELENERATKILERRDLRLKVATELTQSEKDYIRDLQVILEVFKPISTEIPQAFRLNFDSFVASFPAILSLAQQLLNSLDRQAKRDFDNQEIGSTFLDLSSQFQSLYSQFCEHLEFIQPLLEKDVETTNLQNRFNECLTAIKSRTSCFDLNSAMSRPIHRILKYPLFLQEILKNTEDAHPDKVKLFQAIRVMSDAAQTINETKRRKDLVLKYKRTSDPGVADRLSKLNMHSVRKKGTRLSMRLSSTLGLANVTHDEQFHQFEQNFHQMEKSVQTFLRNLQRHCEQLQLTMSQFECVTESLLDLYGAHSLVAKIRQLDTSWHIVIDKAMQQFFTTINERIRRPLMDLLQLFSGPAKLIEKRNDKLLDFDAVSGRMQKANRMDQVKFGQLQEELKRAKSDYECLNVQLILELPRFVELSQSTLTFSASAFVNSQCQFLSKVAQSVSAIEQFVPVPFSADFPGFLASLRAKQVEAVSKMSSNVSFVPKGLASTASQASESSFISSLKPTSKPSGSVGNKVSSISRPNVDKQVLPSKRQTDSSRNLLLSRYDQTRLFTVVHDHRGGAEMELSVNKGDLLGVIVKKDPLGNETRWFMDNSEAKGFVPQHILVPYSAAHQPSAKTLPIQRFPSNNTSSLIDLSSPVQTDLPSLNQKHLEDMKDIEFQPTTAVSSSLNFRYSTAPQTPYYSTVSAAVVQRPVMPVQPIITKPADPFGEIYQKAKVDVLTNKPNLSLAPSSRPSSTCFQQSQLVNTTSQGWHRSNSFTNAIEMSSSHQTTELTSHPPLPQPLSTVFVRDEGAQPLQRTNETTNVATTQQQKDIRRTIGGSVRYHNSRETATAVLPKSVSADKFTNSTAVPVRPAPAPPQLSNPVRDSLTTESTLSSPDISAPGPEFVVVEYDFSATEPNELSVVEGQTVALLSRTDEKGNNEWWMVEDEYGNSGFVPSNYLSELNSN